MFALVACLGLAAPEARAQQTPIARYARITGNVNFVATGGSLRTQSNDGNACAVGSTSSAQLSGIPAGSTIRAAYLYWGGSGGLDNTVTLNGAQIRADDTFTTTVPSPTRTFFGGFADITARISGNATLTFGGLSVQTGGDYCSSATVVAGWAVIVIYSRPTEPLRAINVFHGLESFYGSALELTPNGFRIPASGIDGKMTVVTWDGDPANSDALNGFSESLRFNGAFLDDGIFVPGSNPATQQYDGTINSLGISTSWGVDIDTYNVSSLLSPGQTSASTLYSSGGDRVFLTAQIVSVTSEPIVDLAIAKTHSGNFTVGGNATYTLVVSSLAGSNQTDYPVVVTDTLPAGLTYSSASGAGWNCGASGQTVTCTHQGPLAGGASLPPITLHAAVGEAAFPSVTNTAQVTTPSYDPDPSNNVASDVTTVLGSNLSTSTKSVVDLNGGDANPGDTLRYTITLTETAGIAATNVTVTDHVPANVSGFAVTSIPAGAINNSTFGTTGANGTGFLNVSGITVPANGSVTIAFTVQVAAGMPPGATIVNTATVTNPSGTGAAPSAPTVMVSASAIPGSGTKQLYLRSDLTLYRTPPTSSQGSVTVGTSARTWTLTPPLRQPVTLAAGNMNLRLLLTRSGPLSSRAISVRLTNSALGTLAQVNNLTLNGVPQGSPDDFTITLTLPQQITAPANSTFSLSISNAIPGLGIDVWPYSGGDTSRLELNSLSVINVDSVQHFSAPYPGGTPFTRFSRGSTVYVRAVVSDPFGSFDINGANVTIIDPNGTSAASAANVAMTQVADSGAATRTYEFAFVVPSAAPAGAWTTRVVAREGTEGTVTDLGIGAFDVVMPALSLQKLTEVVWDPVNAATNPKRIPGSIVRYTISVTNGGPGSIDAGTLVVTDPLPPDVELCIAAPCGGGPAFIDGTPASGLSFVYANDVAYSSTPGGGPPYDHPPSATPEGYDPNIRGIRIVPAGAMNGANGAGSPGFDLTFRVRVR